MANPKNGKTPMTYRMVVLVTPEKIAEYDKMMDAIGANRSEHIRDWMDAELALYKAEKK